MGIPGKNEKIITVAATIPSTRGFASNCVFICVSSGVPAALLVTTIPAAVDIKSAGTCETNPSPIVKMVYCCNASVSSKPR